MSYCFNPDCQNPQNPNRTKICQSCGTSLWLQDRYQAIQLLGQGMRNRTFQVLDENQSPPVLLILKQFRTPYLSQAQGLITHWRELGIHPSIPKLIDTFEQEAYCYLVQQWIEGIDLVERVTKQGVFSAEQVWKLLTNILPALQFIHDRHFLHRDIQPAHIIDCSTPTDNRFMLVNWSALGRMADRESPETPIGSPEYSAPEQLNGQATAASDLYSLGVSCLYLLTGMRPFDLMDTVNHTWLWRSYWFVDEEDRATQSCASRLGQILDRLISSSLSDRYTSATEVLRVMGYNSPPTQSPSQSFLPWQCHAVLQGHQGLFANVNAVAFSTDGKRLASGSDDRTIRLWHPETGESLGILRGHSHSVKAVAFSPLPTQETANLASGGTDGTICLWDLDSSQAVHSWRGHEQGVNSLTFNPTGKLLASGSADKTIKLWNPQQCELVAMLTGHRLAVTALAFSPSPPTPRSPLNPPLERGAGSEGGILASASQDRTLKIWDLQQMQPRLTLTGHTWAVQAIAFSPDGSLLASGGDDNTIRIWDVVSGQLIRTLSSHSWSVTALVFLPHHFSSSNSSFLLISASWDKTLKVWQINTGQCLTVLTGHTDSVSTLAISPVLQGNSQMCIASGSQDKTVRLWNLMNSEFHL
ncbi:MAG: protein kinase domain-containing protein, partial [Microcystaceae cyanobacterium]